MNDFVKGLKYDEKGLIPAIVQDCRTDEVLMLAYMDAEALQKTLETGKAHYFSRSRQQPWFKGETSGHFQLVKSISYDCDCDTLLLKVEQAGAACHTGHHSCFYRKLEPDSLSVRPENMACKKADDINRCTGEGYSGISAGMSTAVGKKVYKEAAGGGKTADFEVLKELYDVISDRAVHPKEGSYTNYLFQKGLDKILKKIGEETSEVVIAAKNNSGDELKGEVADLFYHIMVLLVEKGLTPGDICGVLKDRS